MGTLRWIGLAAVLAVVGVLGGLSTGGGAIQVPVVEAAGPSCTGASACSGATGAIGTGSCNGIQACALSSVSVGEDSCNGIQACGVASGTIGDGSCNDIQACGVVSGTIGDGSCNGGSQACATASGTIGDGACNGGAQACADTTGNIGAGSCIGAEACDQATADIGENSCNGPAACFEAATPVGDCSMNTVPVPACDKPTVEATFFDQSTGAPYVPGTPTRGPVVVRFECLPAESGAPILPAVTHGSTLASGNTYPTSLTVTTSRTLVIDPNWHCIDADGKVADPPAGFPLSIVIDRRAPTCSITLSRTSVPKDGTPTGVTVTVNGTDSGSGVATREVIAISPAATAGPALPAGSPGVWTLKGAFAKTFTITGEVTDLAGNTKTCNAKVTSR